MIYIYMATGWEWAVVGKFGDAGFLVEDVIAVIGGGGWVLAAEPGVFYNSWAWRTGTNYTVNTRTDQSAIFGRMTGKGVTSEFSGSNVQHSSYRFNRPADRAAVTARGRSSVSVRASH